MPRHPIALRTRLAHSPSSRPISSAPSSPPVTRAKTKYLPRRTSGIAPRQTKKSKGAAEKHKGASHVSKEGDAWGASQRRGLVTPRRLAAGTKNAGLNRARPRRPRLSLGYREKLQARKAGEVLSYNYTAKD